MPMGRMFRPVCPVPARISNPGPYLQSRPVCPVPVRMSSPGPYVQSRSVCPAPARMSSPGTFVQSWPWYAHPRLYDPSSPIWLVLANMAHARLYGPCSPIWPILAYMAHPRQDVPILGKTAHPRVKDWYPGKMRDPPPATPKTSVFHFFNFSIFQRVLGGLAPKTLKNFLGLEPVCGSSPRWPILGEEVPIPGSTTGIPRK